MCWDKICKCENKEFTNNDSFCEWMFNLKGEHVALAHNFKSYDSSFIIEWILEKITAFDDIPKVLMNGSKIFCLDFRNIRLIDSLSFLPMPLEKFSKTFEINELKKGFFPHAFN